MAITLSNTFEGGSDETTITTGNSGGSSGDAFTVVSIGAGNTLVYDNARAAFGSFSARFDLASNPNTQDLLGWTGYASETQIWGWVYVYCTSFTLGITTMRLIGFEQSGTGIGRINLTNTGTINVEDKNFAHGATSTGALSLNTWMRVGYRILCSATVGEVEARIYTLDSATPITNGTVQTTASADTGTGVTRTTFGSNAAWTGSAYTFWLDQPNVNTNSSFGPQTPITTTFGVNF
jgi:hypothetical protein